MLEKILQQIDTALESDLYYVALFSALAIPDLCGALDSEDGEATKEKYIAWIDKYFPSADNLFNGSEWYRFRCSMLHQGRAQHSRRRRFKKVVFLDPEQFNAMHDIVIDGVLYVDIFVICGIITTSARRWYEEVKDSDRFKRNYSKFIGYKYHRVPGHSERLIVIG